MLRLAFLRSKKFYSVYNTSVVLSWKRCLAVVGNPAVDKALTTITGGRIDSWLQKYEELVGLREVKEAQHKVIEVISFQYTYLLIRINLHQLKLLISRKRYKTDVCNCVKYSSEQYLKNKVDVWMMNQ